MSPQDQFLSSLDQALRTLAGRTHANRPCPVALNPQSPTGTTSGTSSPSGAPQTEQAFALPAAEQALSESEKRHSAALMRVNHVGEVCAQALYQAQALTARSPALREQMLAAAREETDHLAWTRARLDALGGRPSLLNPLWYAGAFGLGLLAGRLGDAASLGFVVETERQVEQHLAGHLERLPAHDLASRAIVAQMKVDEGAHAEQALQAGAQLPPPLVRSLMRGAARVMTTTAHRI